MLSRHQVRQWLEERFLLRLHMTFILGGTFVIGLVTTRMLMMSGVNNLVVRYVAAVAVAYLFFLVLVKIWLMYVGSNRAVEIDGDAVEWMIPDAPKDAPSFHGGGSKGSWGGDISLGGDLDDLILIIVLIVFVLFVAGFAIYFIYTAPAILSEAAFEAALAGALARRTKKATGPGWVGAITRATIWPFLGVLVLSGLLGYFAQRACPGATRLGQALQCDSDIFRAK